MKHRSVMSILALALISAPISALSQSAPLTPPTLPGTVSSPFGDPFIIKAQNLARQTAVNANGGLSQYRPEASMFGSSADSPHQKNSDGSITFTFKGGSPGYSTPTLESAVTVRPDGTVIVNYNGPIRAASTPPPPMPLNPAPVTDSAPSQYADEFLTKAQNLARQAAIKVNGGLSQYRPEAAMFGPSVQSPYTRNANNSLTFNFKGGPPGTAETVIESVVTVMLDSVVIIEYNGPVRQR